MRYWLILFLLVGFNVQAKPINEKYSNKGFPYHNVSFKDRPASEFNDTIIRGSCFYQEWIEGDDEVVKDIFPDGMVGVHFTGCNLDNIYIPVGNTIDTTTVNRVLNRKLQVQNDWSLWILDNDLKPKEPLNKEERLEKGISIEPESIPTKKFTKEERDAFENLFSISP